MKFNLIRIQNTPDFCLGRLYVSASSYDASSDSASVGDYYLCDTLEPPVRDAAKRVPGKTAVPAGLYMLLVTPSPRFRRPLPLLIGVPNMNGVRIHRGNSVADTAGCILPGHYVGNGRLVSSTQREQDVLRILEGSNSDNYIEVINAFVSSPGQTLPLSFAAHVQSDASAPDLGPAPCGSLQLPLPAHADGSSCVSKSLVDRTTIADLIPFELRLKLETQIF